jgi:general secretion pathway protein D
VVGEEPSEISYPEFLTVLSVYGYAAIEDGKFVQIVPDANLRQYPTPIITSKDTRPGYDYVTQVISVKYVSAAQLIPILRPMIAQYGHFAAFPGTNLVLISDHFANVRRIEALIRALDVAEPVKSRNGPVQTNPADASTDH